LKHLYFAVLGALLFALAAGSEAAGQALPTASRLGDLQAGGGVSLAKSDYVPNKIWGYSFYADFDVRRHLGVEADFREVKDSHPDPLVPSSRFFERTYEIGGRYRREYKGRFVPYGKLLYGRGVIRLPAQEYFDTATGDIVTAISTPAYNLMSVGGGLDYRLMRHVNLRADFEYQHWFASDSNLPNGLTPKVLTFGAAYHFGSPWPKHMTP
jgi:opacity protein-like surface antigen